MSVELNYLYIPMVGKTIASLQFGNGEVISPLILLDMWLLFHAVM